MIRPPFRVLVATLLAATLPSAAAAQQAAARGAAASSGPSLAPKRSLTLPAVAACLREAPPATVGRRDELAARTVASRARELALVGDRAGARTAFARAVALDPSSAPLAYDLARASEEAGDTRGALAAYCQFLALAPTASDARDARARVGRLSGGGGEGADRRARDAFSRGLVAFDAGVYATATSAFSEVLRETPNAPEASYNRGLAELALGRDTAAARDLAAYVASPAAGPDRGEVLRAVDALRRPVWSSGTAFTRGLVPGFGQLYTARPVAGVAVLAATATAVGFALSQQSAVRDSAFVDRFGNRYTSPITVKRRPYLGAGLGAAALLTLGAAFEAAHFAAGAGRGRPAVSIRTALGPALEPAIPGDVVTGTPVSVAVHVRF